MRAAIDAKLIFDAFEHEDCFSQGMPDPESVAAVSTAVSETMKGMGSLFGPAKDEIGQMFADHARAFRLRNQLKLFQKTKKYLGDSGIPIGQVNLKVLFPLIENASLEEDESLQDMWAKILTQAASGTHHQAFLSNCVDVLKGISGEEARALELMYAEYLKAKKEHDESDPDGRGSFDEGDVETDIAQFFDFLNQKNTVDECQSILDNLMRLGLVRYAPVSVKFPDRERESSYHRIFGRVTPSIGASRYFLGMSSAQQQILVPNKIHLTAFCIRLLSTCGVTALGKS